MWKTLFRALLLLLSLTLLTGILYPLAVTGLAQLFFPDQANGSLVRQNGKRVGSTLIGQSFQSARYFQGRPSSAGYDGTASGGTNLAPTNRQLLKTVQNRVAAVRAANQQPGTAPVPSDLVTASASGLDPHISPQGALFQAARVAKTRRLPLATVRRLVKEHTERPFWGVFGEPRVNVLRLNMALDSLPNEG
ncbi:K+-transporting ATPase ATPase C chain [Hydrogenispora ethanolica]|jgi:K+-transporting ATPase ATPase C chain|uniref:Potassium-transporting ATPase KdpC subunit n=1 Tax=Hydrogenispora ethanolica TaxID=1082276 RepID=A0A4V2QGC7_HYDET|nr:potassium-transporting ATPase subunit KdpC [Hydrogenispora ethanolica]TCL75307.1 K+-transporting ATPase ATPase C chain [Hydrogenispora ethanolica]